MDGEVMKEAPDCFLPLKIAPAKGDKIILSPAYIFPANIMARGLFAGVSLITKTIVVDASNGRTVLSDSDIRPCEAPEFPCATRELPVKLSEHQALYAAEMMATPEEARGWRRGFNSVKVLFRTSEFKFVWHTYIIRGSLLIDAFTGDESEAADVIDILLR